MTKKRSFWFALFAGLFLLSQDFIFWNDNPPLSIGGFPLWMYGFVLLQIALVAAVYWFSKEYWR